MTKSELLADLKSKMEADTSLPLANGATRLVFGDGNPDADIVCIGEGPGYWEDQKGLPFVGNAGKLLDQLLALAGLTRQRDVYITNVVHHRPPENRDPSLEEIAAYGNYLDELISIISPRVIITLGRFSMGKFIPGATISRIHGKSHTVNINNKTIVVVPMYHPAAALRSGAVMKSERQDFVDLAKILTKIKSTIEEESNSSNVKNPEQIGLL